MFELGLRECANAFNATLIGDDVRFSSVSTDTRTMQPGDLFVALRGEFFDAHEKIDQEVAANASALVVDKLVDVDIPQLQVENTLRALGDIARQWRRQITAPVIAITGSNGKTTVKEMTASILRQRGDVFATKGNLNNEIGLPLSLLSTRDTNEFVVLELGANHAGEIAYLVAIARPAVALVNNAGPSHLEGFGSLDGVASAKGEIYGGLDESGVAIINVDDPYADQWREMARGRRVIGFGMSGSADVRGEYSDSDELIINYGGESVTVKLPLRGRHNAMNALAASAATLAIDTSLKDICAGLECVRATRGRLDFKPGFAGTEIIDDSYNANPASLAAGLAVLSERPAAAAWCVLGDMRELGDNAADMHREVGRVAKQQGVDYLLAVGDFAGELAEGFGDRGRAFSSTDALIDALRNELKKDDRVLVKGSRGSRMERVVEALTDVEHFQKNNNMGND